MKHIKKPKLPCLHAVLLTYFIATQPRQFYGSLRFYCLAWRAS
jgi:hypothetical protein